MKNLIKEKPAILVALIAICLLAVILVLRSFPVYRIATLDTASYFDSKELSMLAYAGTPSDRSIGQGVIKKASSAFSDIRHSQEENKEVYGLLSRYATPLERGAVSEKHILKLLSAHFDSDSGYMWVHYSAATYDADGKPISQSSDVSSFWSVEKNEDGDWVVVGIKEHP